ncbi:PE-PPE domain-containing protein [Mycobacterium sp. SMC-4]|uniref:PE-PPE domain-containing protein n=1 Tax=Mycobacterium sp. SMC-4 TaxID=2857059 RepID=UPI003D086760
MLGGAFTASALLLAPSAMAAPPGGAPGQPCGPGNPGCHNNVTALLVGGEGSYAQLTEEQMSTAFGGYFAGYKERISVPFPGDAPFEVSVPEGSDNLYNAIYAHQATKGNPLTIGGVSKGAASVVNVLYRLLEDYEDTEDGRTPPSRESMTVALYGAPGRMFFWTVKHEEFPETPWDTIIVSGEYDGIADMPDNLFNILAVLNAIKGAELLHVDSAFYDVTENPVMYREVISEEYGSKTTYVVIPAERLPLLHDMYESDFWDPGYVSWLEKVLRPIIDSAYKRNWFSQRGEWHEGMIEMPAAPTGYSTPDGKPLPEAPEEPGDGGVTPTATGTGDGSQPETEGLPEEAGEEESLIQASLETEYRGKHRLEDLAPSEEEELDLEQIVNEEVTNEEEGNEVSEAEAPSPTNESDDEGADAPEPPADTSDAGSENTE